MALAMHQGRLGGGVASCHPPWRPLLAPLSPPKAVAAAGSRQGWEAAGAPTALAIAEAGGWAMVGEAVAAVAETGGLAAVAAAATRRGTGPG